MSRCFPFPPPGYEERLRPEEILLKEEKRRDKKVKKEKKDKEKREGKDKKKREKGDGKHKDKRDKKENHRVKKEKHKGKKDIKDENKRNDNEKSSISEDASIVRELEARRTGEVHMGEVCFVDRGSGRNETKSASLWQSQHEQEFMDYSIGRETAESKFLHNMGRRIRDKGMTTASSLGRSSAAYIGDNEEISSGAYIRMNEELHRSTLRDFQSLDEVKAHNGDRGVDQRQEEGQALQDRAQFSGTAMVRGLARSVDSKVEEMHGSLHRNSVRIVQWTHKRKEDGDHKRGEQSKCKDKKEEKNHRKDKGREIEKKLKERTDHKSRDQENPKTLYEKGSPRFNNSNLLEVDTKVVSTEENVKKRKNVKAKGLVSENELRHNKLPRVTLYLPKDNDHIACRSVHLLDSDKKGIPSQYKEDSKNFEVSGTVDSPTSYISKQMCPSRFATSGQLMKDSVSTSPADKVEASGQLVKDSIRASPADKVVKAPSEPTQASLVVETSVKCPLVDKVIKMSRQSSRGCQVLEGSKKHHHVDIVAEPSRKSPHPDMKYLNQVLSVPGIKEWPEVDNEDWLFSGKDPLFQKQKHDVNASCDYGQQLVWSESLHVESADIYALPYVIPY